MMLLSKLLRIRYSTAITKRVVVPKTRQLKHQPKTRWIELATRTSSLRLQAQVLLPSLHSSHWDKLQKIQILLIIVWTKEPCRTTHGHSSPTFEWEKKNLCIQQRTLDILFIIIIATGEKWKCRLVSSFHKLTKQHGALWQTRLMIFIRWFDLTFLQIKRYKQKVTHYLSPTFKKV